MPFTDKPQVFSASINTFTFGPEGKEVSFGGSNVYPLYSFDAPIANAPKIGIEVSDLGVDFSVPGFAALYEGCDTVVKQAERACTVEGADFVVISLEGANPNGENKSVDEEVELVKAVAEVVDKPLAIQGCKNVDKDAELFQKIADALQGKNVLLLSCKEENYKAVSAGAVLACNQNVGGESAVDINLAKQLNVLLSQMGVNMAKVVTNPGSAAAGYGFEYLASTIERIKAAALTQNDTMLQMPIVTSCGNEAWNVKETLLEEADAPEWGAREERGIQMEVVTASAVLAAGSDAVILRHPESIKTISGLISTLC